MAKNLIFNFYLVFIFLTSKLVSILSIIVLGCEMLWFIDVVGHCIYLARRGYCGIQEKKNKGLG